METLDLLFQTTYCARDVDWRQRLAAQRDAYEKSFKARRDAVREKVIQERLRALEQWKEVTKCGGTTGKSALLDYLVKRQRGIISYVGRAPLRHPLLPSSLVTKRSESIEELKQGRVAGAIAFLRSVSAEARDADANSMKYDELFMGSSETTAVRSTGKSIEKSMLNGLGDPQKLQNLNLNVEGVMDPSNLIHLGATNLISLSLNVNRIAPDLRGFRGLQHLRRLHLRDNNIASLAGIETLTALESLNVETNRLTSLFPLGAGEVDTTIAGVCRLPQLRLLNCRSNQIIALPSLLKHSAPRLNKLDLSQNHITMIPQDFLLGHQNVRSLDLGRNRIIDSRMLGESLSRASSLQHVHLNHNQLSSVPHPLVLPVLESLNLGSNSLSSLTEWEDDGASWLPCLETVSLQDNCLTLTTRSNLRICMPHLASLDLSFNNLKRQSEILSCVIGLPDLTSLDLTDNPWTDDVDATNFALCCPMLRVFNKEGLINFRRETELKKKLIAMQCSLEQNETYGQRVKQLRSIEGQLSKKRISLDSKDEMLTESELVIKRRRYAPECGQFGNDLQWNVIAYATESLANEGAIAKISKWDRMLCDVNPWALDLDYFSTQVRMLQKFARMVLGARVLKVLRKSKKRVALALLLQHLYRFWQARKKLQIRAYFRSRLAFSPFAKSGALKRDSNHIGLSGRQAAPFLTSSTQAPCQHPQPQERTSEKSPEKSKASSQNDFSQGSHNRLKNKHGLVSEEEIQGIMKEWAVTDRETAISLLRRRKKLCSKKNIIGGKKKTNFRKMRW